MNQDYTNLNAKQYKFRPALASKAKIWSELAVVNIDDCNGGALCI